MQNGLGSPEQTRRPEVYGQECRMESPKAPLKLALRSEWDNLDDNDFQSPRNTLCVKKENHNGWADDEDEVFDRNL